MVFVSPLLLEGVLLGRSYLAYLYHARDKRGLRLGSLHLLIAMGAWGLRYLLCLL